MDEYHASHKRLRASYPGSSGQGSSPSDGLPCYGPSTPEPQGYPAPSSAMATSGSTQSNVRKDSPFANGVPSNGKRKVVEVVDLTKESDAKTPLPKPPGPGDLIDLTDKSIASWFSKSTAPKDRFPRELAYRAKKLRLRDPSYPQQYPYAHQYSTVQGSPSLHEVNDQLAYSSSFGSGSQPLLHTQGFSTSQKYSHPQQYAYAQQSKFPQLYPQFSVSVPQTFGAADAPQTTATSSGKAALKPGAQFNTGFSAPTHSPVNRDVQRCVDPRESTSRRYDVDAAFTRQIQHPIDQEVCARTVAPPNSVIEAQEHAQSKLGTLDPHATRALVQSWGGHVRRVPCSGCRNPLLASEMMLNLLFKKWVETPTMTISSVVSCDTRTCFAQTCLGCGRRCNITGSEMSAHIKDGSKLYWCCDSGRMILLWILMCGCDRRKTVHRRRSEYFKKPSKSSNISGAGVGYGSHTAYGSEIQAVNFGMYGQMKNSRIALAQPVDAPPAAERAEDQFTARVMACLDALLPSLVTANASEFDLEPPAPLLAVLTQSCILGTVAALLRNDSLEDATKRIHLYNNTLNVVDKLSSHPATADSTVNQPRQENSSPSDILRLSFSTHNELNGDKYEETDSLASCLHNLETASKSILTRAKANPQHFAGDDSVQMLSLCERVKQTAELILTNARTNLSPPDQTAIAPTNDDWQSQLAVLELDDDVIMTRHIHAALATSASNLAIGRMKSLSIQLSNLTSSVPSGVFVRYCASRIDVMKILIIGPKGTPYENGLFEFDLFCPPEFPNAPPKMTFRTTGGGKVRFNPNLYNDGKGMHTPIRSPS